MQCFFCPNPAAHDATGCRYSPRVLACRECTVTFWAWVKVWTNKRPRGARGKGGPDFYEAAGKWRNDSKAPSATG